MLVVTDRRVTHLARKDRTLSSFIIHDIALWQQRIYSLHYANTLPSGLSLFHRIKSTKGQFLSAIGGRLAL